LRPKVSYDGNPVFFYEVINAPINSRPNRSVSESLGQHELILFYFVLFFLSFLYFRVFSPVPGNLRDVESIGRDATECVCCRAAAKLSSHTSRRSRRQTRKKGFAVLEDDDGNGDRGRGGVQKKDATGQFSRVSRLSSSTTATAAPTHNLPLSVTLSLSPSLSLPLSLSISLSLNESARAFFPTFFHRFFLTFAPLPRRFSPR
jgi:hypothetical protein